MAIRSRVKQTAKNVVRGAARQVFKTLDSATESEPTSSSSRDFGLDRAPGGTGAKSAPEAVDLDQQVEEESLAVSSPGVVVDEEANSSGEVRMEEAKPVQKEAQPKSATGAAPAQQLSESEREGMREEIAEMIQTVHDPEIPVNIYELGLIYDIDVAESGDVVVKMTLTSPNCPAAQSLPGEVEVKTATVEKVCSVVVDVVWDPPWDPSMMSESAQLELNMF